MSAAAEKKITAITGGEVPENWNSKDEPVKEKPVQFCIEIMWQGSAGFEYLGVMNGDDLATMTINGEMPVVVLRIVDGNIFINRCDFKAIKVTRV